MKMKEAVVRERSGGSNGNGRSAVEKERTKLRERQRRSITTNIFHGLRKHGGYHLSPRADINEVLRHLAHEAGWIVEPDGTTYRSAASSTFSNGTGGCPLCGGGRKSAPQTPSCSYLGGGGGGAGDCSTTTSPRRVHVGDSAAVNNLSSCVLPSLSSESAMATNDTLLAIYMCTSAAPQNVCGGAGEGHQSHLLREPALPNQNATAGSP